MGFYSINTIVGLTGLSRVTIWRLQNQEPPAFPRSVRISPGRVGVPIADYLAWEERHARREAPARAGRRRATHAKSSRAALETAGGPQS